MKDKREDQLRTAVFLHVLLLLFEAISLNLAYSEHGASLFQYYTYDAGLLQAMASLLFIVFGIPAMSGDRIKGFVSSRLMLKRSGGLPPFLSYLRFCSVCGLWMVLLVVLFVLVPANGIEQELFSRAHPLDHLLVPLLSFFSYLFFEGAVRPKQWVKLLPVCLTLLYAAVLLPLNALGLVTGPYFFLDIRTQPIYASLLWFIALLGLVYGISWIVYRCTAKRGTTR